MPIRWLPFVTGIVPLVGIHICFLIAVDIGYLPACNPYIDGCASISATGRQPPASLLFRAVEIPVAALMLVLWPLTVYWLRKLNPAMSEVTARAIWISGIIGGLSLIVYTTFLGTEEPFYGFLRRFGVYFYFLGVTFAQLFTALALLKISRIVPAHRLSSLSKWMLALCTMPFALGVLNLVQKAVLPYETADHIENSIEWFAALMLQLWFIVLFVAWRRSGFDITVSVAQR